MPENPDGPSAEALGTVHRIDQAQASAFERINALLGWISDWLDTMSFSAEEKLDALNDPMAFMALLKIMRERVSVDELPNLMAAAILSIARTELKVK